MSETVDANLALARRGLEVWNTGGVEASLEQIWAPDIVFYEAPELPDTDVFHAPSFRRALPQANRGCWPLPIQAALARGTRRLRSDGLGGEHQGTSSGAAVTTSVFQVARYGGGRQLELHTYLDGDQAWDEYESFSTSSG